MAPQDVAQFLPLVPAIMGTPHRSLWSSYDAEADCLYINFKEAGVAEDSILTDDDIIVRYAGGEIIGLTILRASTRTPNRN